MLQNRMVEFKIILHILVKGLIVLKGPKTTLALLFIVVLNMDFFTSRVDAYKQHLQQLLSFLVYKKNPSKQSNRC
jgi:hypothetical protein